MLHFIGHHDDDTTFHLVYHPPEVNDSILQTALCGYVVSRWCISWNFSLEKTKD